MSRRRGGEFQFPTLTPRKTKYERRHAHMKGMKEMPMPKKKPKPKSKPKPKKK
jgi:hypothetical protein